MSLEFEVVGELSEDYTGTKLDRPELDKLRGLMRDRAVEAVIVYSSDRLTRNIAHSLVLRDELRRACVELHYCTRGKANDTPEGRMTQNIEAVFDEYWREKIIESSRRGMHRKAREGRVVGVGKTPYGYRHIEGHLEICEPEAEVIRRIYQWYTAGDGTGQPLTMHRIAERLSLMRVPTPRTGQNWGKQPSDKPSKRKQPSGIWSAVTVEGFLHSETYAGVWRWGKTIGAGGKGGRRAKDEQVAVPVPPIVSREQWQQAQERIEYNKRMSARNTKREYLLRGLIYCKCGKPMQALGKDRKKGRVTYYRCGSYYNYFASLQNRGCTEKSVPADQIEPVVWDKVYAFIRSDPAEFERALREAQEAEEQAKIPKRDELDAVLRLIAECEGEAEDVATALRRAGKGVVAKSLLKQQADVEKQYESLTAERDKLRAELDATQLRDEDVAAALEFRADVAAGMDDPTFYDMRRVLEILKIKVTVRRPKADIDCIIPSVRSPVELCTATSYRPCRSRRR